MVLISINAVQCIVSGKYGGAALRWASFGDFPLYKTYMRAQEKMMLNEWRLMNGNFLNGSSHLKAKFRHAPVDFVSAIAIKKPTKNPRTLIAGSNGLLSKTLILGSHDASVQTRDRYSPR